MAFPCPKCGANSTVVDNMLGIRKRACRSCNHTFATEEVIKEGFFPAGHNAKPKLDVWDEDRIELKALNANVNDHHICASGNRYVLGNLGWSFMRLK